MDIVEQYDSIELKDGRKGCVVEKYDEDTFDVDVGDSPTTWETIIVNRKDISKIIKKHPV